VGVLTAADLFASIGDIRRFQVLPDQAMLAELRAKAHQALNDGKWQDDALEVLIRTKTVVNPGEAPQIMTKLERATDAFVNARVMGVTRQRLNWKDENAKRLEQGEAPLPEPAQPSPDQQPMLHLPSLLQAVSDLKAKQGQTNQVAALQEALRLLGSPGDLAADALVSRIRELAGTGGLVDELFEIRDRAIFDRFSFLNGLLRHKRRVGKEAEAASIETALQHFQTISHLKRKAVSRSKAKLRHNCGVFVRSGGKYANVPADQAFPRKRRGETCNWDTMARQRLYNFSPEQVNRQPGSPYGELFRLNKRHEREKHPAVVEIKKPVLNKKKEQVTGPDGLPKTASVFRYTPAHIHKRAGWKTASQFVNLLYDAWMALEEAYRRSQQTA
jgi:hypothetical protein